ncbi:triosephosphate isomerase, partial [Candidatus Uhrbacteria bacterium]|nr:triosephosphate isomerase [Candidatus Uhrbacteria bacterium]
MKTVVANWKMQLGVRESVALARGVLRGMRGMKTVPHVVLAPSFSALADVGKVLGKSRVHMAAQDVHESETGAYTGSVSVRQLKELGVYAVILGHSERRQFAHETDDQVKAKVLRAVEHGLEPIMCVGEPVGIKDAGETQGFIHEQIRSVFEKSTLPRHTHIMIAYEPIWAIG